MRTVRATCRRNMRFSSLLVLCLTAFACEKPAPTTEPTTPTATPDAPTDAPASGRKSLSAAECEAQGGKVVGDIGDGATSRPDYVCADSGKAPIGDVVADPGGPVAIEGQVCC